jgi:glycosyltransferase involved in cell wall biosynthesis
VAAFPVQGPVDIVQNGVTGYLSEDLAKAALDAVQLDPSRCREEALKYTWEACTHQFLTHVRAANPRVAGTTLVTGAPALHPPRD